ncbi:MAG: transcriptional regulator [Sulfurimonas sp. RIFCSPHIGHO2_12_FULL_36_9]|uniref:response regulator transcription factor n=1 Tax=Sulfurimonas sp. RIFCSPLOWO2_12_36_12 TaxID=1802253 RepID=UPI0008AA7E5E|nr:response regulator transcription factor [Sulfurimonas sp. RIFCSPLOWO2_12_36_12]OHD97227.1 MAG: transcriptional regulator [Sulfurimonas sp. RIFCSPLOWO2_02_FULL_36_28]OHD97621.1 MAG: transcriptional regulator [Sulfurimonas sp. RIFCSPHIGHO2_12_FULL_36_9]OHE00879.1 MAG: transcriptional regulator [Sulfurimonas sp. RIFCSPLOWO2_12_36_12]OHE07311.1 MAG: transcriptional regulator [Sulfurimonas sp. RIFCSPLOWO2_12_FULL_36_74]
MLNSKELLVHTKNLSILFVEDHDDLRENTREILKTFFNQVDSAKNGEEAIKKYKEFYAKESKYYDIILSDIQMPKLNGVELVETIYGINPKQIVIIISAYDDTKYLLPLINLGIEQFIKKPIDYQDLLKVLLRASKKVGTKDTQNSTQNNQTIIKLNGSATFNKETNILQVNGSMVTLTKYEIIFLQLLSDNVGKIYSNKDITDYYNSINESLDIINVRKLVSKLRKKLPENCIESIYGIGYRIVPHSEK